MPCPYPLEIRKDYKKVPKASRGASALSYAMKIRAIGLGIQLVERESELERQFASGAVNSESLGALLAEIGALHGKLRYVHMVAHLKQRSLLSEHQIRLYDQPRGYGVTHGSGHGHSH